MTSVDFQIRDRYIKRKFSVQQIADSLRLTPSKVRYTLNKLKVKIRNHSEATRYLNITKFHKGTFKIRKQLGIQNEGLRLAGVMLYWGEGTKSGNSVVLSNSDPLMIGVFMKFLRVICGISENRLRALLHLYEDQNEVLVKKYWSEVTKIPIKQFSKSFVHKKKPGSYKRISRYGTVSLRYSDKQLLNVINHWIKLYCNKW